MVETRPALVAIRVAAKWVARWWFDPPRRGRLDPQSPRPNCSSSREAMLFAHFGLSGPAMLDVSRAVARHDGPDALELGWTSFLRPNVRTR